MRAVKALLLIVALALMTTGCYRTKFNRGATELPGDFIKVAEDEKADFLTLEDDITRRLDRSYQKTVDGTNDVIRWTTQEWDKSCDNLRWLVVKVGGEFEQLRGAGDYIQRRWKAFGPKCKGLWNDTYAIMLREVTCTGNIDDATKRLIEQELNRFDNADKGMKRWTETRKEEVKGLKAFFRRVYSQETERGEDAMQRFKDYFTKKVQ